MHRMATERDRGPGRAGYGMRHRGLAVLLALLSLGASAPRVDDEAATASVSGRVLDRDGEPVVGVVVDARPSRDGWRDRRVTRTDLAGTYRLTDLPPGTWWIGCRRGDDHDRERRLRLSAGESEELVFEVRRDRDTARVHGLVLRHDGLPAAGASVTVTRLEPGRRFSGRSVVTDETGLFVEEGFAPGTYRISTHGADAVELDVSAGDDRRVDFTHASPVTVIEGRTLDETGAPVSCRVTATTEDADPRPARLSPFSSMLHPGDRFRFEPDLEGDAPRALMFSALSEDRSRSGEVLIVVTPGEHVTRDILVTPVATSLTGRLVTATTGSPVPGLRVRLYGVSGAAVATDDDGRFAFPALSPGVVRLRLEDPPHEEYVDVSVRPVGATHVEFAVDWCFTLEGHVELPDGWPEGVGAAVTALARDRRPPSARTSFPGVVDGDRFRFPALPAGRYHVVASAWSRGRRRLVDAPRRVIDRAPTVNLEADTELDRVVAPTVVP